MAKHVRFPSLLPGLSSEVHLRKKKAFVASSPEQPPTRAVHAVMSMSMHEPRQLDNPDASPSHHAPSQSTVQPQQKKPAQDPNLKNLEDRMKEWLAYDMNAPPRPRPLLRKSQSQSQVKLYKIYVVIVISY